MNTVSSYIYPLLQTKDCVVVPRLGAFVRQRRGAYISDGILMPPCTVIIFDDTILYDDGMLVNVVAQDNMMSNKNAEREIEQWVNTVKTIVYDHRGSVTIENLGTLGYSSGKVIFIMSADVVMPDNYGLRPIALSPYVTVHQQDLTESATPILTPSRQGWSLFRAVAAVFVGLMLWGMMPTSVTDMPNTQDALTSVDWVSIQQDMIDREQAQQDSIEAFIRQLEERPYHLIVASLQPEAAEQYKFHLQSQGYETVHIIAANNGLQRVAVNSYDNFREALEQMKVLRKQDTQFARAWVLTKTK